MIFNQTMMVMITTYAVGTIIVYLIRRLSMGCSWIVATATGSATELLVIFVGDFVLGITVAVGQSVLGILLSAVVAAVYNFPIFTVDYTRAEHVQFEDDDYYYYVRAMPRMNVSTPDTKVQRISIRKRNTKERNVY